MKIKHAFAYYLPQYHEVVENNIWWGEGFTEWTNVKDAVPYKKNHKIRYPSELGYYKLDNVEVIERQYKLAKEHGIDTFCFWHYWFDDQDKILEKPAEMLIKSDANVEFCFAWANHTWMNKTKNIVLKEQRYDFDILKYFLYLLDFFKDSRYRKIDNKPVFFVYDAKNCPIFHDMKRIFNERAKEEGFDGIFFVLENMDSSEFSNYGGDLYLNSGKFLGFRKIHHKIRDRLIYRAALLGLKIPRFYDYGNISAFINEDVSPNTKEVPIVFPGWDSTIRHKKGGVCFTGFTPETFSENVTSVANLLKLRNEDDRFIVIKSWNEWAEGNVIEPCNIYGREFLQIFSKFFKVK